MTEGKGLRLLLCTSAAVLVLGCSSSGQDIEVRVVGAAPAAIRGTTGLPEAQSLLNLGNSGLALEAFRKVHREHPSAEALAGIAACYAAMGRDDLAKGNLEAALAMAPQSPQLLNSIATVMDRLGLETEATNARLQAKELARALATVVEKVAVTEGRSTLPTNAAAQLRNETVPIVSEPPTPPTSPPTHEANVARRVEEARRLVERHNLSSSVTAKLPPARPAGTATLPAPPRLERLSSREVALVTSPKPFWAPVELKLVRSASPPSRWVRLRQQEAGPNVRLLNAARVQGLANIARSGLLQRGWRKIDVGDHAEVRVSSVVLYPAGKQRIGRSLAKHFGIAAAQSKGPTVTIVLGRDIVGRIQG